MHRASCTGRKPVGLSDLVPESFGGNADGGVPGLALCGFGVDDGAAGCDEDASLAWRPGSWSHHGADVVRGTTLGAVAGDEEDLVGHEGAEGGAFGGLG